jgi:hypothetical protein
VKLTPLPWNCLHVAYEPGVEDGHGNILPGWAEPVAVACFWWPLESEEPPAPPTGSERVVATRAIVIDVAIPVDHRDRFVFGEQMFEVTGLPKNYDFGPFGFAPNRQVLELRMVR